VRDAVDTEYGTVKFQNSFDPQRFEDIVKTTLGDDVLVGLVDYGVQVTTDIFLSNTDNTEFSFRNEILDGGFGLYSTDFYSPKFDEENVYIADSPAEEDSAGFSPLRLLRQVGNLVSVISPRGVGEINRKTGFIRIFPNVGSTTIRFVATPKSPRFIAGQNMVVNILQSEVNVVPI